MYGKLVAGLVMSGAMLAAGTAWSQTQGVTATEILVGTHQPLSGPVAAWGTQVTNGMRMRADEANAAGGVQGRQIKMVVEDNQYVQARAAQVGSKLLKSDRVFALVGALGTPPNLVVMDEAFERNVPNLFPFSPATSMYEPFHKLKFSFLAPYYPQMRQGVEYFVKQKGKTKVCSMYQDNDFGQEVHKGVADQLKAMNMPLVASASHKADDKDFTAAVVKMQQAGCDLVVLGTIVQDTIIPVATARKMGWNVDFLVNVAGYTNETIAAAQGATEGLYSMTQIQAPYDDSPLPAVKDWLARYKAKNNADGTVQAMAGYIAMDIFLMGVDKAGKDLTVDTLIKGLEQVRYEDKFGGQPITFGPQKRLGTDKTYVSQVKGGKWVKVSDFLGS